MQHTHPGRVHRDFVSQYESTKRTTNMAATLCQYVILYYSVEVIEVIEIVIEVNEVVIEVFRWYFR